LHVVRYGLDCELKAEISKVLHSITDASKDHWRYSAVHIVLCRTDHGRQIRYGYWYWHRDEHCSYVPERTVRC
jgi:hypothetical protein